MDETTNNSKRVIIWIVVIIVIALGVTWWLSGGSKSFSNTPNTDTTEGAGGESSPTGGAVVPTDRLTVDAQFPGQIVYLSSLSLPAGGWVVVQEEMASPPGGVAKPGKVIGSTYFSNTARVGNVDLAENTVDGKSYYASVYHDDGDGLFNPAKDALATSDGEALTVKFIVTEHLPETKG